MGLTRRLLLGTTTLPDSWWADKARFGGSREFLGAVGDDVIGNQGGAEAGGCEEGRGDDLAGANGDAAPAGSHAARCRPLGNTDTSSPSPSTPAAAESRACSGYAPPTFAAAVATGRATAPTFLQVA